MTKQRRMDGGNERGREGKNDNISISDCIVVRFGRQDKLCDPQTVVAGEKRMNANSPVSSQSPGTSFQFSTDETTKTKEMKKKI